MNPSLDREQPGKLASGVMAVLVHVVFFAFLVFGVSWQRRPPEPVVAELWSSLPPVTRPQPKLEVVPPPPAPPVVKPEPPAPKREPKVEVKSAPEPKPSVKPDIALEKEKLEKAKREREQKEKTDLKKREDEREKAEATKREAIEKQKLAALERERAAKEELRAKLEREQNEAIQKLAQQQAAAQNKELDGYKSRIEAKVKRFVAKGPCSSIPDAEILLEMKFFPDGNLIGEPAVRKSSGNSACDEAVRRAVVLAQPLPLPPPGHPLLSQFVNPNLRFKPNE